MTTLFIHPSGCRGWLQHCFEAVLQKKLGSDYITADLFNDRVIVKMDITRIPFPENTFNVIYCSHVLEHVPDDKKAMRELHRVLKNTGWAIILVPVTAAQTIEDPLESDPKERFKRFEQEDHVRRYGPDYIDRLRAASFSVDRISPTDFLSEFECQQMGITVAAGNIYYCRKHD
jgi:SAM-dependent methyltransferase